MREITIIVYDAATRVAALGCPVAWDPIEVLSPKKGDNVGARPSFAADHSSLLDLLLHCLLELSLSLHRL